MLLWTLWMWMFSGCRSSFLSNECLESFYNLPSCVNEPDGYYCNCGPGFKWNSKNCMAAGIDSKMIFMSINSSYTIFRHQTMPPNFTISLWLKPKTTGVLLSFVNDNVQFNNHSIMTITLDHDELGHLKAILRYRENEWIVPRSIGLNSWSHIIWTQKVMAEMWLKWVFYMNGEYQEEMIRSTATFLRGHLILGQFNTTQKTKTGNLGYSGDLTHVNIWNTSISASEMRNIHNDCLYNYCGNVVQWADFRYGTHGSLLLKWPSGLKVQPCLNTSMLVRSCDSACSLMIGAQCKMEITYNLEWRRTMANNTVTPKCPMPRDLYLLTVNSTTVIDRRPRMTRSCLDGKWEQPNFQKCIINNWDELLIKKKELEDQMERCQLTNIELIEGLQLFSNMTKVLKIYSAMELTLAIDVLDKFVFLKDKQEAKCPQFMIELSEKKKDFLHYYYLLIKLVINVASNLFDQQNIAGWKYTKPSGFEGRKLLGIMHQFYKQVSANINNLINKDLYTPREMCSMIQEANIIVKIKAARWSDFRGIAFPDFEDLHEIPEDWSGMNDRATVVLSEDFLFMDNTTEVPRFLVIVTSLYRDVEMKALHSSHWNQQIKRTGSVASLSQKINSEIIDIAVSVDSKIVDKVRPQSLKIHYKFKDSHNISNADCLFLSGDFRQGNIYSNSRSAWTSGCQVINTKVDSAICECDELGVAAICTDMFNDNWNKKKPPNDLIALPSYFGCTVSAVLVGVTLVMLVYLRTSSNTSAIHKHFSIAIVASQLCYMIGIDKHEKETICRVFSLSLHYFFLSCFAWLMNEAFNLYIVITYAAHSHSDNIDGHMWRFYLLGWIMPGIVVGAIFGVNRDGYYAENMCWINQKYLWLFCGPAIVVIAVTILVLIFTAKEQHESSYTKNEKDNKAVVNQTKAIWTQIILLPLSWSFAFLVLRMQGIIVKYLFGLFVSLQGSFYIMFYYLLNDEVQKIYSDRKSGSSERRRLEPSDDSDQPYVFYNDPSDSRTRRSSKKDVDDTTSIKQKGFFSNVIENLNIRNKRSLVGEESSETNNNDNSDYELITTV